MTDDLLKLRYPINSSSLNRLIEKMTNHDVGIVTASRHENSYEENQKKNRVLYGQLSYAGFRITHVRGSYIEGYDTPDAYEVQENSYFVEDYKDKGNLLQTLRKLGEVYNQDSIMFVPKGGSKAEIWGTKKGEDAFFPYGKATEFSVRTLGVEKKYMTKVKGRPFAYEEITECSLPGNSLGMRGAEMLANSKWQDVKVIEDFEHAFPVFEIDGCVSLMHQITGTLREYIKKRD